MKNFEDNTEVIVNVTGELKKTASTRPVGVSGSRVAYITGQLRVTFEYVQRADESVEPRKSTPWCSQVAGYSHAS